MANYIVCQWVIYCTKATYCLTDTRGRVGDWMLYVLRLGLQFDTHSPRTGAFWGVTACNLLAHMGYRNMHTNMLKHTERTSGSARTSGAGLDGQRAECFSVLCWWNQVCPLWVPGGPNRREGGGIIFCYRLIVSDWAMWSCSRGGAGSPPPASTSLLTTHWSWNWTIWTGD